MKIKKKMRIQAFDSEGNQIKDRLVEQEPEFYNGPAEVHEGPLKIEVNLWERDDIDKFITYLKKISNQLPLDAPVKDKPTKLAKAAREVLAPAQREELITTVIGCDSQDAAIKLLRNQGFEFLTFDYIASLGLETGISEEHQQKYQWMLKLVKKAKNPLSNKYDPMLCFGFKFVGKKISTFVIYLYQKKSKIVKMEWENKNKVSFKNTEMIKFPIYMVQEEKDKFRVELYKLRANPEMKPSKFFNRWANDTEFKDKSELLKRNDEN